MTGDDEHQTITVYVLTEDKTQSGGTKEITSCTTDSVLAEYLLKESWYGTMRKVEIPKTQWITMQNMLSGGEVIEYD